MSMNVVKSQLRRLVLYKRFLVEDLKSSNKSWRYDIHRPVGARVLCIGTRRCVQRLMMDRKMNIIKIKNCPIPGRGWRIRSAN